MTNLTRRGLLTSGAALPLAGLAGTAAQAEAPMLGNSFAQHRRFSIGDFEVTTILGGTVARDNPQGIFGTNVGADEFAAVSNDSFLSSIFHRGQEPRSHCKT